MSKHSFLSFMAILAALSATDVVAQADGIATLFTTPQERRLINSNRYKTEEARPEVKLQVDEAEVEQVSETEMEEVKVSFRVSGISITHDGSRTAWINGQAHESGATLEPGVKIRINDDRLKSVTLTAPDGKRYSAAGGDVVEISFMRAVEEP